VNGGPALVLAGTRARLAAFLLRLERQGLCRALERDPRFYDMDRSGTIDGARGRWDAELRQVTKLSPKPECRH